MERKVEPGRKPLTSAAEGAGSRAFGFGKAGRKIIGVRKTGVQSNLGDRFFRV